jgi:hypothetical protein
MDWTLAIARNRDSLLRIIVELFTLAGLTSPHWGEVVQRTGEGKAATLSRHAYQTIWNILRAAESAVRRLIYLAARDLIITPRAPRAAPLGLPCQRNSQRLPAFALIDPLKDFGPADLQREPAGLHFVLPNEEMSPALQYVTPPTVQERLNLCHRLLAIRSALEDLPKQARRLARWQARHRLLLQRGPCRVSPFRPGLPPGHRARATHEVDKILQECHRLMRDVTYQADSS